jgi:hypothetical protein
MRGGVGQDFADGGGGDSDDDTGCAGDGFGDVVRGLKRWRKRETGEVTAVFPVGAEGGDMGGGAVPEEDGIPAVR